MCCVLASRCLEGPEDFRGGTEIRVPITTPPSSGLSCTAPAPVSMATNFNGWRPSGGLELNLTNRTIRVDETTCNEETTAPMTAPTPASSKIVPR